MTLPSPKVCRRIRSLHAMIGSSNANEAASARERLMKLLDKHGLSWNDIPACIRAAEDDDAAASSNPRTAASRAPSSGPEINVLDLLLFLIEKYVAITPDERIAV